MQKDYPEIESLKLAIEKKTGGKLTTPSDFDHLTSMISHETGCHVGLTTVKRLWGYIENNSRLRESTLSIFARFVGHTDWADFCSAVHNAYGVESSYLSGRQITAASLAVGDLVEIGWPPDRYCLVRHTGGSRFSVEEAINCKLHVGDTFSASLFCIGQPLYITDLTQDGDRQTSYIAGTKHGLTLAKIKNTRQKEDFAANPCCKMKE